MLPETIHTLIPTLLAALLSAALVLACGRQTIAWLKIRCREPNASPSPEIESLHRHKDRTPTMGGMLIALALLASVTICGGWKSTELLVAAGTLLAFATLGAIDDLTKLRRCRGLRARGKLVAQVAIGALSMTALVAVSGDSHGLLFVGWGTLVMVASSNAVNLTDGLDGLASGCVALAAAALAVLCYLAGNAGWAAQLGLTHVAGGEKLAVIAAALAGAMVGFLWFNRHPARVFMGNTGSLMAGGLLGFVAIAAGQELMLVLLGGVFVIETLSVIVQLASYRLRGKRVLRCAPLHHHFQLLGWSEPTIVTRFWLAATLCVVLSASAVAGGSWWKSGRNIQRPYGLPATGAALADAAGIGR